MTRTSLPPKEELLRYWATRSWRSGMAKGDKSKSILLRVPPNFHIELKELALVHGMSLQDFILQCCEREIAGIVKKYSKKKAKR
jgi:hypothetical protein